MRVREYNKLVKKADKEIQDARKEYRRLFEMVKENPMDFRLREVEWAAWCRYMDACNERNHLSKTGPFSKPLKIGA